MPDDLLLTLTDGELAACVDIVDALPTSVLIRQVLERQALYETRLDEPIGRLFVEIALCTLQAREQDTPRPFRPRRWVTND